jgi:deazaflavin-dependent oxidoreductase (nitroreductase family)
MMQQPSYVMPRATVPVPNLGRLLKPPQSGSPLWRLLNVYSNLNVLLYRLTGGRVGGRMGRAPVLLLHHRGRKSGNPRVTPVLFLADRTRLVIVGSKGGTSRHPAWFGNLIAQPDTTVEVARRKIAVRARVATESERAEYWPRLVEMYPSYSVYQERTDRSLPIVVLEWTHARD